jgi:hypothetical protein
MKAERQRMSARFPPRSALTATPSVEFVASLHVLIAVFVLLLLLLVGHSVVNTPR